MTEGLGGDLAWLGFLAVNIQHKEMEEHDVFNPDGRLSSITFWVGERHQTVFHK